MQETKKRSPTLDLRQSEGNYVIGEFINRYENKNFPGKYDTLIKIEDTNGSTTLWDKELEKEVEVSVEAGDTVFIREGTWLANIFKKMESYTRFRLEYTGKGKPKKKGFKPADEYSVEVL